VKTIAEVIDRSDRVEAVEWLTFIHVGLCARASAFGGEPAHVRRMLTRYVAAALLVS
jgi:hypothetical protein